MTACAGIEVPGRGVIIAADSQTSESSWTVSVRTDAKAWRDGPYVLASAGSVAERQVVQYRATLPAPPDSTWDLDRFMATQFVDELRRQQSAAHTARSGSDGSELGPTLLVGIRDRLYIVYADYQVGHPACGYETIGSGSDVASGALHALTRSAATLSREQAAAAVHGAITAAIAHRACCSGPIMLISNEKDQR